MTLIFIKMTTCSYGLNYIPSKDVLKSSHLVTVNVTLFGKRAFADRIKLR